MNVFEHLHKNPIAFLNIFFIIIFYFGVVVLGYDNSATELNHFGSPFFFFFFFSEEKKMQ